MTKTVAQTVVDTLKEIGVKHVFGVPSGGWVDYMEAVRTTEGIEFILASHEGGAGFMADVCGRLTGAPGVCFGTFGPGATNLSTGVGSAFQDRSPMIALTDEIAAPMRGRITQMGIDHQALFRPITKKTTRLEGDKVKETLYDASKVALSARPGPVHVGLPVGLSAQVAVTESIARTVPSLPPQPDQSLLEKMQILLRDARKPVLAIGLGAVHAGVQQQVLAIAEKFQLPIVLTPMAKGMVPESHASYAGVLFHALSDQVGHTHQQADLVISIGYDPIEFNYEQWMPNVPLVSIDTVPTDIDTGSYTLAADIVGDISSSLAALENADADIKDWDMGALADRRQSMFAQLSPDSSTFGPCAALDTLRDVFPLEGIMTCDVGAHIHLIGQKWITPKPEMQIMTNGWSAMGFAIPAAIAAKLCKPDLPVCAVVGDGGFLMTAGELAVAVRQNLKIVFVLFTDNDLALIRIKQEKKDNPIYGTPIREQGTIGGDNIFGVPVTKAYDSEQFRQALNDAFEVDGPTIVEAILDSREYDGLVLRKDKP